MSVWMDVMLGFHMMELVERGRGEHCLMECQDFEQTPASSQTPLAGMSRNDIVPCVKLAEYV